MIFKCHDCESEFDEKYAVYYETPGNPKCPVCGGSVAGIRPADLPEAGASAERISSVVRSARDLVKFGDWILASKIQLCDRRCLMKDIDTEFGKVKSNQCDRESCPELVLKLLLDDVRAHFL